MKIEELVVLLPCHSLEDFPVHHEGEEAAGLLAAWTGLWHPALIAACGRIPNWFRADAPPENLKNRIVVIPQVSDSLLLPGWPTRAKTEGAKLIRKATERKEVTAAALALLDPVDPAAAAAVPSGPDHDELAADFTALGFGYLTVELLTRQMRYMSNLDEVRFGNEAVAAAQAWAEGRDDDARTNLKNAFEALYEARERFYPVDNFLIDLTLTADTTLGPSLGREVRCEVPFNLLISGKLLEKLATSAPENLTALRHALDRHTACIVGGEYDERETTLTGPEAMRREFVRGRAAYQQLLGFAPVVYGRRRQGLHPLVPTLLAKFGFTGSLGFTLDDGVFPEADQGKVRWEGLDASAVDCYGRAPLDAAKPESFLDLSRRLGESMDRDMVATLVFAHWPGATSPYYDDLRRIAGYAPVLGKFIRLSDYFENTERPGQIKKFSPDRYRTTYLRQSIVRNYANPNTWAADAQRRRLQAEAAATFAVMTESVRLRRSSTAAPTLLDEIDETAALGVAADRLGNLDVKVGEVLKVAAGEVASVLGGTTTGGESGLLLLNPLTTSRRELVDVTSLATLPTIGGQVVSADAIGDRRYAVVTVPGLGFTWLRPGTPASKPRKPPRSVVEENRLGTDLFDVTISPKTGGVQGVFARNVRGNRLSQQLTFRLPAERPKPGDLWRDPDLDPPYATMVCDALETTMNGPLVGEITSRGRIVGLEDRTLARFVQRVRAAVGLPRITVEIELEVDELPRAEAWGSYYVARFAWADESTQLARGVLLTQQATAAKRPETSSYLELSTETTRTLLLVDGLSQHVSTGTRMLDTLLISRGETRRQFRFGIVLDAAHPAQEALAFQSPPVAVPGAARPSSGEFGRLFHVDAKNVVATNWESLYDGDRVIGFRVRLLETEGCSGRVELHAPRTMHAVRQIDALGATLVDVPAGADNVAFEIAAFEWIELEAKF
jgi:alpha-mannosidase